MYDKKLFPWKSKVAACSAKIIKKPTHFNETPKRLKYNVYGVIYRKYSKMLPKPESFLYQPQNLLINLVGYPFCCQLKCNNIV